MLNARLVIDSILAVGNIDDEYIRRYVGHLDPFEESCLVQLRQWVAETHKGKVSRSETRRSKPFSHRFQLPNDSHLLRFLRARRFDIEKARENVCHSLAWYVSLRSSSVDVQRFFYRRKKNSIDRLLLDYESPDVIQRFFPGAWGGNDRDGRPIYVLRIGDIDVRGLMKALQEDGWIRHVIFFSSIRQAWRKIR